MTLIPLTPWHVVKLLDDLETRYQEQWWPTTELARRLNVSRYPLRKALNLLEQQGAVDRQPGRVRLTTRKLEILEPDHSLWHQAVQK